MNKLFASVAALAALLLVSCAPEPGSLPWCEAMDEKPKGDWTANEAGEYASSCIFRSDEEEE
jgi:hypothetical protein